MQASAQLIKKGNAPLLKVTKNTTPYHSAIQVGFSEPGH
jgi:hypothetical protein